MFKHFGLLLVALLLSANTAWAAEKTVVFASDATWPPMEFLDANKQIVGFSVELLTAMGKAGGFKVDIKNTAWDGIFAGLDAGKYNAISSSVTITDERKKTMDFSDPYFEVIQAVVIQKDSPIKSSADLKGKKVGAQIGTTGFFAAKKIEGAEAKSYDEIGLAAEDLFSGRIDAVVCDDPIAANYALQHPDYSKKLKIGYLITDVEKENLGFAVKKGDKDTLDAINKGLKAVKASGEYATIKTKWFGK